MNGADKTNSGAWLDRFFEAYYQRRPVNATFIGVHSEDHRLPDISSGGVSETISEMRVLLAEEAPPEAHAGSLSALDRRLAEGFLRIQLWEYESGHFLGNPSIHAGEAVFGMMSLLLSDFAPLPDRLEALGERMRALPEFLAQAQTHLESAPVAWTLRAIRECSGGLAFVRDSVSCVDPGLTEAAKHAERALTEYRSFLQTALLERPHEHLACGPEAFDLYLRDGHCLTESADDIVAYAREEMARAESDLSRDAPDFGVTDPADVLSKLPDLGPDVSQYYGRYQDTWNEMRRVAQQKELLTWPEFPIRYCARPEWARSAAPDLYFLYYRSPAAFHRPPVHDYLVTPIDESMPPEERESLLRAHNDGVIKLNHVVHHGGIGHHVQNWHAFRSPLRVGRVAAVDCASRVAMFCGATMAEGWACYATDLTAEAGGLTPLEQYAERYSRVRMCARAIVDVELHHGRLTLDEAAAFYEENAGMSAAAAEAEAVKNSMFPAAAIIYLLGTDMIHELRAELIGHSDSDLTLRTFHDSFLSYGSIPVRVIGDEMRRRAALGLPLGAHDVIPGSEGQSRQ